MKKWYQWFQESENDELLIDNVRSEFVNIWARNEDEAYELLKAHIPVDIDNRESESGIRWDDESFATIKNLTSMGFILKVSDGDQTTLIFSKDSLLIVRKKD